MGAILGGLFNSRLNMKLREEKGYTYGAGAGFDLRRGAGPFTARAAVNTEVTVPAVLDTLAELDAMRDEPVSRRRAGRRARLPGRRLPAPVRDRSGGRRRAGRPGRPRPARRRADRLPARIEAVDVDAVAAAARAHLDLDQAAIVLVGDVDAFGPALEAEGLGRLLIEPDDVAGVRDAVYAAAAFADPDGNTGTEDPGPIDEGTATGPTAGAEEPSLPGPGDDPVTADTTEALSTESSTPLAV